MEECNEDCLGSIITLVPRPDWPALALLSQQWHTLIMKRITPLSTVAQCEQACCDGDFLAVTRAATVEPIYFNRGTNRAGRGGHYQLGQWLIAHNLGSLDDLCYGACRGGHSTLVELLWPRLPNKSVNLAVQHACRGGHLSLVEKFFPDLDQDVLRHDPEVCILPAFKSGAMALIQFLEQRISFLGSLFWSIGLEEAYKHHHTHLVAICLARTLGDTSGSFDGSLAEAIGRGDEPLVALLMERGAQISDPGYCVIGAFGSGNVEMIKLVSHLEDDDECEYWECAFAGACISGSRELMEMTAEKAASHDIALRQAVRREDVGTVRWILSLGKIHHIEWTLAQAFTKRRLECAVVIINHSRTLIDTILKNHDPHVAAWVAKLFGASESSSTL